MLWIVNSVRMRLYFARNRVGMVAVDLAQVDGNQAGLPVVGVQHVGPEVEQAHRLEHGPAEEDEALAVVGVVARRAVGAHELVEAAPDSGSSRSK